jgi:hypothetical protein
MAKDNRGVIRPENAKRDLDKLIRESQGKPAVKRDKKTGQFRK